MASATLEEWTLNVPWTIGWGEVITMGLYNPYPKEEEEMFPMLMVHMFCLGSLGVLPQKILGKLILNFVF